MRTLLLSDLHLGARSGVDLLGRGAVLALLLAEVERADRVVLLGDAVELREGPVGEALRRATPALAALGEAAGARPVVVVPGNHDHRLIAPWLERRRPAGEPLGLEQRAEPAEAGETAGALAAALGAGARVELAYPGLWVTEGVYALHGHHLDRHVTVPAFEPLGLRVAERLQARRGALPGGADGYEALFAPVFAFLHELAQTAPAPGSPSEAANVSGRAYRVLTAAGRRGLRERALGDVAFPAVVAALNAAGLGPMRADVSGPELRRSSLRALGEVVRTLAIGAQHVVFGHTHRAGPFERDDHGEWAAPDGARLHNGGSWVVERFVAGGAPERTPYRAGHAVVVEDGRAPELLRVVEDDALVSPRGRG